MVLTFISTHCFGTEEQPPPQPVSRRATTEPHVWKAIITTLLLQTHFYQNRPLFCSSQDQVSTRQLSPAWTRRLPRDPRLPPAEAAARGSDRHRGQAAAGLQGGTQQPDIREAARPLRSRPPPHRRSPSRREAATAPPDAASLRREQAAAWPGLAWPPPRGQDEPEPLRLAGCAPASGSPSAAVAMTTGPLPRRPLPPLTPRKAGACATAGGTVEGARAVAGGGAGRSRQRWALAWVPALWWPWTGRRWITQQPAPGSRPARRSGVCPPSRFWLRREGRPRLPCGAGV